LGGSGRQAAATGGKEAGDTTQTVPPVAAPSRPVPPLAERRAELDRLLREELERQGIIVSGQEVARVVGAAVGKGIEWQA